MKKFIKQRLREDLDYHGVVGSATNDEFQISEFDDFGGEFDLPPMDEPKPKKKVSGPFKAYHGTTNKITNFSDEFVGGAEANDQEGPGIYFTTDPQEAIKYADGSGFVYEVTLNVKNLVSNEPTMDLHYLTNTITKLVKMNPNWKSVAKGYDEGLDEMIANYIHMSRSEKEVFVAVYNDVYKGNATSFVRNMVKLGYDGLYLPMKNEGAHIVVYDPTKIKVTNVNSIG